MRAAAVEMYSTSWCPYCERARALLAGRGAALRDIDIEAQPGERVEMIRRSGRQTVPQIFIDGRHVGGSEELEALDAAGALAGLLRHE